MPEDITFSKRRHELVCEEKKNALRALKEETCVTRLKVFHLFRLRKRKILLHDFCDGIFKQSINNKRLVLYFHLIEI